MINNKIDPMSIPTNEYDALSGLDYLPTKLNLTHLSSGMIYGSYIYLWPKNRGIEPGFWGIPHHNQYEKIKKIILNDPANEPINQDQPLETLIKKNIYHQIHAQTSFKLNPESKIVLSRLADHGFPLTMIKMDYKDGKIISFDNESARHIPEIESTEKYINSFPLLPKQISQCAGKWVSTSSAKIYTYATSIDYTTASVNAFKEYFVTEKIARNILGTERVQEIKLISRDNQLEDGTTVKMFALGIRINPDFHEFSESDGFQDGQRINLENKIYAQETEGLGETFALQAVLENYDAFGWTGANGGYDKNGYFMIDLGKALYTHSHALVDRTNRMLLLDQGCDARHFSIYDNTSLISRVKGLILLAHAMGENIPEDIIQTYGEVFYAHYNKVKPLDIIFDEYKNTIETQLKNSPEAEKNHWQRHALELDIIKYRFKRNANILISKCKNYLALSAQQINLIEGLTKLSLGPSGLTSLSYNQKIILNKIRILFYLDQHIPHWKILSNDNEKIQCEATLNSEVINYIKQYLQNEISIQSIDKNKYSLTILNKNIPTILHKVSDAHIAFLYNLDIDSNELNEIKKRKQNELASLIKKIEREINQIKNSDFSIDIKSPCIDVLHEIKNICPEKIENLKSGLKQGYYLLNIVNHLKKPQTEDFQEKTIDQINQIKSEFNKSNPWIILKNNLLVILGLGCFSSGLAAIMAGVLVPYASLLVLTGLSIVSVAQFSHRSKNYAASTQRNLSQLNTTYNQHRLFYQNDSATDIATPVGHCPSFRG